MRNREEEDRLIEEHRIAQLRCTVVDHSIGRRICCHDFSTWYWTVPEATAFLIALTAALERALDPTPIEDKPETPRLPVEPKGSNLEDLA